MQDSGFRSEEDRSWHKDKEEDRRRVLRGASSCLVCAVPYAAVLIAVARAVLALLHGERHERDLNPA
jgi:hypothetical protein